VVLVWEQPLLLVTALCWLLLAALVHFLCQLLSWCLPLQQSLQLRSAQLQNPRLGSLGLLLQAAAAAAAHQSKLDSQAPFA
jgi:hypothetical protein